jgi:signal transduction histidine kinase
MAISTTDSMAIRSTESMTNKNGKGVSMAGDPVTVYADPLRTRQIIRNLVANATKHGGDKIALTTGTIGSVATLTVPDNGSGIPHEQTEQMFDLFWSEQRSVTNPGSIGIGLAVSRALAQAMQGALTYERTVDGTNAFTLELPMHRHIASSEIG